MDHPRIYARIDLHPTRRTLLRWGATLLCASAILAAILRWLMHRPDAATGLLAFGVAMLLGSALPGLGRVLYVAWLGLGLTLGRVTSPLILAGVYFLLVVPIGVIMRLCGRDSMQRKPAEATHSYWQTYPEHDDPTRYLGQF